MPRIGDIAPDFEAVTTAGRLRLSDYAQDKWLIMFSHPADFTPVCTTELGRTAALKSEFDKRNVKALAVSVEIAVIGLRKLVSRAVFS